MSRYFPCAPPKSTLHPSLLFCALHGWAVVDCINGLSCPSGSDWIQLKRGTSRRLVSERRMQLRHLFLQYLLAGTHASYLQPSPLGLSSCKVACSHNYLLHVWQELPALAPSVPGMVMTYYPQDATPSLLFLFFSFFFKFILLFYFLAVLGFRCCMWAFSRCGERGLLFVAVRGLLIAVASLVAEHGL